jgi:hypothetical protein
VHVLDEGAKTVQSKLNAGIDSDLNRTDKYKYTCNATLERMQIESGKPLTGLHDYFLCKRTNPSNAPKQYMSRKVVHDAPEL